MKNLMALAIILALMPVAYAEHTISGRDYRIIDGDTVHFGENKIRLIGIDAPERNQYCQTEKGKEWPCGLLARDMLSGLAGAAESLTCVISGTDRYKRLLGTCFAVQDEEGLDVQKVLVQSGLAVAEYDNAYQHDEDKARANRRGMWRGCFTRPKDWRRKKRNCR